MSILDQYAPIAVLLILTTAVSVLIAFLSRILGPSRPTSRKLEPYESGMVPIGPAMRRFPVKFYLVAVLFILFDIEVVFFLPYATVARQLGVFGLLVMGTFFIVLTIGFVYEWRKGGMEWE